ncbi:MAG: ATP-binding protein [Myxococcales bacterium]
MPQEVAVTVLDMPFRYLRRKRVPVEPLLEGLGHPARYFFRSRNRIDWSVFVELLRRIGSAVGADSLADIGHSFLAGGTWLPLKLIMGTFATPRKLYHWIETRGSKLLFSNIQSTLEDTPDGVRIQLLLTEGYEPSEEFFLINKGVQEAVPCLLGYPPASIAMHRNGRTTVYDIILPPKRAFSETVRGFFRSFRLNRVTAAAELERQLGLLEQQHRELQAAKAEVDALNASLEKRVEERTRELSESKAQLEATVNDLNAAMDARDRLFANLNHEFRTPISLILLPLERMLQEPAFEPFKKKLLIMQSNARRLLRLVDGILEIAASREGRLELRADRVDVGAVARRAVDSYGAAAENLGLTIRVEAPQGAIVMGDEDAIGRIFDNLLGNAIKYTHRGGDIDVRVEALGDSVRVAVRDTGVGIPPEDQARIFERFERSHEPVAAGASSSGIGLAVVQELCRAHGGAVAVRSAVGQGSTFEITLPCVARRELRERQGEPRERVTPIPLHRNDVSGAELTPSGTVSLPPRSEAPAGAPLVLIVEDHPDLRSELAQLLGPLYRLRLAENGQQALALLAKEPVDLVLSDMVMPGIDGLELCRRLKQDPEAAPFILVTAVHDPKALVGALDLGADDFLVKPFNEAELLGRVRAQLRLREMAKALAEGKRQAALGTMLSGMAHELRNPINVLVNGIEPLRDSLREAKVADPAVDGLIDAISDAGRRVAGLTAALLAFRRDPGESGTRVGVPELIDQSLALLRPKLARADLAKKIDCAFEVRGSAHVLSQVVMNLVENALQATGGKGPMGIEAHEESDAVVVDVWDEGPGVPAENRDRIFEPFFSTKRPGEGTGLGLAISRQIAERHGGHLALAESEHGARFRLTLPRASP